MTTRLRPLWQMGPIVLIAVAIGAAIWRGAGGGRRWIRYPESEVAAAVNVHEYRGAPLCQGCHVWKSARLIAPDSQLCGRCHAFHSGNHPVDVPQRKPSWVRLPLDAGGLIRCHTCHDSHDLTRQRAGLRMEFNALCRTCHPTH